MSRLSLTGTSLRAKERDTSACRFTGKAGVGSVVATNVPAATSCVASTVCSDPATATDTVRAVATSSDTVTVALRPGTLARRSARWRPGLGRSVVNVSMA